MKVLLVQDVEKLGRAGDLKEVSGGYGRNYLIPQGLAVLATRGQVRQAEERLKAQTRRVEASRRDAEALAARISGTTLRFVVKVGEGDRLYGSVTNSDIAEQLARQIGAEIDRRKVDLEDPIKRIGHYPVKVRLIGGVEPVINVIVEGEGGAPVADVEPALETPVSDEAGDEVEDAA
jgi:large subunit ribosomal protein L9